SWIAARAGGDPVSGTRPIGRLWLPVVGHLGADVRVLEPLTLFITYDRSFRAPNLDDLTSRQQTGPGFQFENDALEPERAHSFELGMRARLPWLLVDAWAFETFVQDAIIKVSQTVSQCPPNTLQCQGSWARLQLQNAPSYAELRGAEAAIKVTPLPGLALRATVSYVWSEGPRVGLIGYGGQGITLGSRVPLSKTPPFNGTAEAQYTHPSGLGVGVAYQWARAQTRLAIADYSDGRIPKYGTPGFRVLHVRMSYRMQPQLLASVVLENVFDAAYRFHGSSVNGAQRGVMAQLELEPF
ncbi:MAG TPA: TonB-dependent receptor, partial [Myxococcota bacterium]|nr:TonB-dependent receptor [Myxococcota bacterium]